MFGFDGAINGIWNWNIAGDTNDANMQMARENIRLQKEFAQNSRQWAVEDAKKAGLHPLYALGGGTTYTPVHADRVTPQMNINTSGLLQAALGAENQAANTELMDAQAEYWSAMADKVKGENNPLAGQNSANGSDSLVNWYFDNADKSSSIKNGNVAGYMADKDTFKKQIVPEWASENPRQFNLATFARGILDGTIKYDDIDMYMTALAPGVTMKGSDGTMMEQFWSTLGMWFNLAGSHKKRAYQIIRDSDLPFKKKVQSLYKLLRSD